MELKKAQTTTIEVLERCAQCGEEQLEVVEMGLLTTETSPQKYCRECLKQALTLLPSEAPAALQLCSRCHKNKAGESAECPYQKEINGEVVYCDCCQSCTQDCVDSI